MSFIKRALFSVLLFFISCSSLSCSSPCPKWSEQKVSAPCVNSYRKIFPSPSTFDGFSLEISEYPDGKYLFANLELATLPTSPLSVTLETSSETYQGIGIVFEGGQRIELPCEWIEKIEQELEHKGEVTLSFLKFHSTINSENWRPDFFSRFRTF